MRFRKDQIERLRKLFECCVDMHDNGFHALGNAALDELGKTIGEMVIDQKESMLMLVNNRLYDVSDIMYEYYDGVKNYAGGSSPKVEAIKAIRKRTGADLSEAKNFIEKNEELNDE